LTENIIKTDVLVVGGGGAACFAAVHAKKTGADVAIVCKGKVGKCGNTLLVGGGVQCDGPGAIEIGEAGDPRETKERMFKEMVIEGFYLSNQKLVEVYCRDAAKRIQEWIDWGYRYRFRPPGGFSQMRMGEQGRASAEGPKKYSIDTFEDVMILDVLTNEGKCVGALGLDINSGEFITFKAKSVILATGGWAEIWSLNSNCDGTTGDGQAIAYRAGAELTNMEMYTWNPGVILWPPKHRGSIFGYIVTFQISSKSIDAKGDDILKFYDLKTIEIAERSKFNKNIWSVAEARTVMNRKGSPRKGVYLSWKHVPNNILEALVSRGFPDGKWQGEDFTGIINQLKNGEGVEVASMAHYAEGGIIINENCETSIKGLYASGESAAGVFGSNRAHDATTEMIVLGGIAGDFAGEYARDIGEVELDKKQVESLKKKYLVPLNRREGVKPVEFRKKMQKIGDNYLWIIKNGELLEKAVEEIEQLRSEVTRLYVPSKVRSYNLDWVNAIEAVNMFTVLEATAKTANMRKESRGVHYRSDFLKSDPDWLVEIVVREVDGKMDLYTRPVTVTSMEPPSIEKTWDEYVEWAAATIMEMRQ
jgi:succinate dehydrogenase/fumarate reductase flavoprotein subunit